MNLSPEVMSILGTLQSSPADAATKLAALSSRSPHQPEIRVFYAVALRHQGKVPEAMAALRQVVARFPKLALAHREMGITSLASDKVEDAARALEIAISLDPADPVAWHAQAEVLSRMGRSAEAQNAREEAGRRQEAMGRTEEAGAAPELDEARHALVQGDPRRADMICRMLLSRDPDNPEALCLLASTRQALGDLGEARSLLERALTAAPEHALARVTLASTLQMMGAFKEARVHLDALAPDEPKDPNGLLLLARVQSEFADYEAALRTYETLIKRFGKIPMTLIDYGMTLRALGRQQDAITAFREAEAMEPGRGLPWFLLADLKAGAVGERDAARMEGMLTSGQLNPEDEMLVSFAVGIHREERKDWEGAFAAWQRGNALQRQLRPYNLDADLKRMEALIEGFDEALVAQHKGAGHKASDPIFILGLPRSGSTLFEQILASHSQVDGTFELPEMMRLSEALWSSGAPGDPTNYCNWLRTNSQEAVTAIGETYIDQTRLWRSQSPRFVDKMLGNFLNVGLIKLALPNARIIEVRKEPMAHCFSMWKQLFRTGMDFTYDMSGLAAYYVTYTKLMNHWRSLFADEFMTVAYEDLVADKQSVVRRLLEFCDLPFEEACLEPHKTMRVVRTTSSEQVRQPIHSEAVAHWKHFESHLEPLRVGLQPLLEK